MTSVSMFLFSSLTPNCPGDYLSHTDYDCDIIFQRTSGLNLLFLAWATLYLYSTYCIKYKKTAFSNCERLIYQQMFFKYMEVRDID